jgi:protein-S-isoprenylcysteine O-methyltransferase Ste14
MGWRWTNVPVPEPFLAALGLGVGLHLIAPLRLPLTRRAGKLVGWPLVLGGIGLGGWAVASAGETDVERPGELVTTGAYATSRNPMYVGWSMAILGAGVLSRAAWVPICWAIGARFVHREILREEAKLARAFGSEYEAYRGRVSRYLSPSSVLPGGHTSEPRDGWER